MGTAADLRIAGRVAFTYPDFVRYESARFFIVLALEMLSVAVGWQVYDITKRPLDLGLIGLAQFLPGVVLFLPAGHAADRLDRRSLLTICYAGFALASGLLLATTWYNGRSVHAIYAIVVFLGIVRTFNWPVSRALLPLLVAEEHFPNAVAWNSSIFQGATILGPAAGGVIYAFFRGPAAVYASALLAACAAMVSTLQIHPKRRPPPREPVEWDTVLAGFQYVWRQKVVLGSISLDMFAVLLGGAVALLSVRTRNSAHRTLGTRTAAQRAWSGRRHHGQSACASSAAPTDGSHHAVVRGRIWRVHHCFRDFPQPDAIHDCASVDRRD